MKTHHQALQNINRRKASNLQEPAVISLLALKLQSTANELLGFQAKGVLLYDIFFVLQGESSHLAASNLSSPKMKKCNPCVSRTLREAPAASHQSSAAPN